MKSLLETASRGALGDIPPLLCETAAKTFQRLLDLQGKDALTASLKRHGRVLLDSHVERALELSEGIVEFRLRLYRLEPGGQVSSCAWVAQAKEAEGRWRVCAFDRLPELPDDPPGDPA